MSILFILSKISFWFEPLGCVMNRLNINIRANKNITVLILFLLLSCLIPFTVFAEETLTILYTGSILGEVKPCGCAEEGDLGGILRRATLIEKERSVNKNLLLLDAGDSFKEPSEQGKLKAKTIVEAMNKMGYDAALLGERDFVYGGEILNQGPFDHWVLSNVENKSLKKRKTKKYVLNKLKDGTTIAIIGLMGPELVYSKGQTGTKIEDPGTKLAEILKELKAENNADIVLLLTHMQKDKAKELFNFGGVDIVINGHLDEAELVVNPEKSGNKIMVHVRERGQFLGMIKLSLKNHKIQNISNEYLPLTSKIHDSPLLQAIYNAHEEEIKQLFLKWLKDKKKAKKGTFITAIACEKCHSAEYDIWKKSGHGHAYNSLKKAKKTFDPECLICHTTAFKKKGGFLAENITPGLVDVQCEECHGAGREHMISVSHDHTAEQNKPQKFFKKVAKDYCLKCHTRENSPGYEFSTYWSKIKH